MAHFRKKAGFFSELLDSPSDRSWCKAVLKTINSPLCEIRVPTYRRPNLLRRALQSVLDQTYPNWICCVFDDCPQQSAAPIVEAFCDPRFIYMANKSQMRAIGNIDQCFRNTAFVKGDFACVLEDDNYMLPAGLQGQLAIIEETGVDLLISAQLCENVTAKDVPGELLDLKTLVWIYDEGFITPDNLCAALIFSHAFSNGSAFWRLGGSSDLEVGSITQRPGIQETLRVLKINARVYISHRPAAVWRWNSSIDSSVSLGSRTFRQKISKRIDGIMEAREAIDYKLFYLRQFGRRPIKDLAKTHYKDHLLVIEHELLKCGVYSRLSDRSDWWRLQQWLRWGFFRSLVPSRLNFEGFAS